MVWRRSVPARAFWLGQRVLLAVTARADRIVRATNSSASQTTARELSSDWALQFICGRARAPTAAVVLMMVTLSVSIIGARRFVSH